MLDSGDTFFSTFYPYDEDRPQMVIKAGYILKAMNLLHIDAWVPGELDFTQGRDFLVDTIVRAAAFPTLGANAFYGESGEALFKPSVVVERAGLKILIIGLCNIDYNVNRTKERVRFTDPAAVLKKLLEDSAGNVDLVVVLSHLGLEEDKKLAGKTAGVDLIVGGHSCEQLSTPVIIGRTLICQAYKLGKYAGTLQLLVDPSVKERTLLPLSERGENSSARIYWKNMVMPLERSMGDDDLISRMVKEYRQRLVELYSNAEVKTEPKRRQVFWYVRLCAHCHVKQWEAWKKTDHARALATLEKQNSHFDMECIGCHTIGFRKEGGWSHPSRMKNFENVQCEACHGPGSDHSDDVFLERAGLEKTCRGCHDDEHNPDFDFNAAVAKIRCPKRENEEE